MNILLTGASPGIGAATFDALTAAGHEVAGHSSRGDDRPVAAGCHSQSGAHQGGLTNARRLPTIII